MLKPTHRPLQETQLRLSAINYQVLGPCRVRNSRWLQRRRLLLLFRLLRLLRLLWLLCFVCFVCFVCFSSFGLFWSVLICFDLFWSVSTHVGALACFASETCQIHWTMLKFINCHEFVMQGAVSMVLVDVDENVQELVLATTLEPS